MDLELDTTCLPHNLKNYKVLNSEYIGNVIIHYCKNYKCIKEATVNTLSTNELYFYKQLTHRNIMKLEEYLQTESKIYLVMAQYQHNLHEFICLKPELTITEIKIIFTQIIESIIYLHDNTVCHGDLKLENILLLNKKNKIKIQLIDFETTRKHVNMNISIEEKLGTIYYCSPEMILNTSYNPFISEIWALGVVLFTIIEKHYPFYRINNFNINNLNKTPKLLKSKIEDSFKQNKVIYKNCDSQFKNILTKIFTPAELRIDLSNIKVLAE
jgi:serine/threonine protein kinase